MTPRAPGIPLLALFASAALHVACHQPCDSRLYYCGLDPGSPPVDTGSTPRTSSTAGGWDHVASGYFHSCALQDGGATCWGLDDYGQVDVPYDTTGPYGERDVDAELLHGPTEAVEGLALGEGRSPSPHGASLLTKVAHQFASQVSISVGPSPASVAQASTSPAKPSAEIGFPLTSNPPSSNTTQSLCAVQTPSTSYAMHLAAFGPRQVQATELSSVVNSNSGSVNHWHSPAVSHAENQRSRTPHPSIVVTLTLRAVRRSRSSTRPPGTRRRGCHSPLRLSTRRGRPDPRCSPKGPTS